MRPVPSLLASRPCAAPRPRTTAVLASRAPTPPPATLPSQRCWHHRLLAHQRGRLQRRVRPRLVRRPRPAAGYSRRRRRGRRGNGRVGVVVVVVVGSGASGRSERPRDRGPPRRVAGILSGLHHGLGARNRRGPRRRSRRRRAPEGRGRAGAHRGRGWGCDRPWPVVIVVVVVVGCTRRGGGRRGRDHSRRGAHVAQGDSVTSRPGACVWAVAHALIVRGRLGRALEDAER